LSTLLVTCVDARIRDELSVLEDRLGIAGGDRLQVPGGPLALVTEGPPREAVTAWIELLVRFKDVRVVYLVSHEHCLAYQRRLGGFFHDEREILERDLHTARRIVEDKVYGVRAECYLVPWVESMPDGGYGRPLPVD
jgi:carbonic anhydrase